jgi:hypothetical protein
MQRKQTSSSVEETYKKIAKFSISPIKYSIDCLRDNSDYSMAPVIGCLTIPWTPFLTIFTLVFGAVGIIGYSFVAPFEALGNLYAENYNNKTITHDQVVKSNENKIYSNHILFYSKPEEKKSAATDFKELKAEGDALLKDINDNIFKPTQTSSNLFQNHQIVGGTNRPALNSVSAGLKY